jgi:hypothetical protein
MNIGKINQMFARLEEIQLQLSNAESRYRAAIQPINQRFSDEISPLLHEREQIEAACEEFCAQRCAEERKRSLKFDCGAAAGFRKVEVIEFADGADEEVVVGLLRDNGLRRFIRKKEVPALTELKLAIKQKLISEETARACKLILSSEDRFWYKTAGDIAAEQMMKQPQKDE